MKTQEKEAVKISPIPWTVVPNPFNNYEAHIRDATNFCVAIKLLREDAEMIVACVNNHGRRRISEDK